MIELNLIPDVKREFIRSRQQQAVVITISMLVGIAAGAILLILALLIGGQTLRSSQASSAIDKKYEELQQNENISSMLTIQQQLSQLSTQNSDRTVDSRVFDVLDAVNPAAPNNVTYSTVKLDPVAKTIMIEGSAKHGYVATDVLKKTILNSSFQYTDANGEAQKVALTTDVNIQDTHFAQDSRNGSILQFSLLFTYADDLFANSISGASIVGPKGRIDVTDSKTHVPDIFSAKPKSSEDK